MGKLAFVVGRHQQELPALALVRAGVAEIGDVVEPRIVDDAQHVRRRLHDHGTVLQVDPHEGVDHRGITRQEQAFGVQATVPVDHGLVVGPPLLDSLAESLQRGRGRGHDHDLHGAREVHVIPDHLRGLFGGEAVNELQGPQACFRSVGGDDIRGDLGRVFHFGWLCVSNDCENRPLKPKTSAIAE